MSKPVVRKYGSNGILMEWESVISPEVNDKVVQASQFLIKEYSEVILEIVPSYHSLLIYLKKGVDLKKYIGIFRNADIPLLKDSSNERKPIWQIPTCYHESFGFEMKSISQSSGLSIESIIRLHSESIYRIYGMGFLPGFLYLGGLSEQLHFPRKSQIKQMVPKGSVAIGGKQTGIYPQKSPGGWNVIGRTPIELLNAESDKPSPFSVGDLIQFCPIELKLFDDIQTAVREGNYQLKSMKND